MSEHELRFSTTASNEMSSFKLVALPPELCSQVEADLDSNRRFEIKGNPKQDAVFCAQDTTYSMRSVVLSNSILIVTPPPDTQQNHLLVDGTVIIRDSVTEVLELNPIVPKLHQLDSLLEGFVYDENSIDEDQNIEETQVSFKHVKSIVQASEKELIQGLCKRRILNLNGVLRPISLSYLADILGTTLNLLVTLRMQPQNVLVEKMCDTLTDEHRCPPSVSSQVMSWFGTMVNGRWAMDIPEVVKTIGMAELQPYQQEAVDHQSFLHTWREKVGDQLESHVDLALLSGNVLKSISPPNGVEMLTYYPRASLPIEPVARFSELFSVRQRWNQDEIAPFLQDIAMDTKARDQLLLKYARAVTGSDGIWYTARTQYAG